MSTGHGFHTLRCGLDGTGPERRTRNAAVPPPLPGGPLVGSSIRLRRTSARSRRPLTTDRSRMMFASGVGDEGEADTNA